MAKAKREPDHPRSGRPPRAGAAADVVLSLRLTEAERNRYKQAARAAGVAVAEWARATLNQAADRSAR